jgi:hypothetical protein
VGTWFAPAVTRAIVKGNFPTNPSDQTINPLGPYSNGTSAAAGSGSTTTIAVRSNPVNTKQTIVLGPGKWAVSAGMTFESSTTGTTANMGWGHAWLSTSPTVIEANGFTHLGPAKNNTAYAGVLYGYFLTYTPATPRKSFISGSTLIEVTGTTDLTIYLLLERLNYTYKTNAPQNYFYAVPIN